MVTCLSLSRLEEGQVPSYEDGGRETGLSFISLCYSFILYYLSNYIYCLASSVILPLISSQLFSPSYHWLLLSWLLVDIVIVCCLLVEVQAFQIVYCHYLLVLPTRSNVLTAYLRCTCILRKVLLLVKAQIHSLCLRLLIILLILLLMHREHRPDLLRLLLLLLLCSYWFIC